MPVFSKQEIRCQICGIQFDTDFQSYRGRACSPECWRELDWRKTLSVMGEDYRPQAPQSSWTPSV